MICGWIGVVRESFEDFEQEEVLILLMFPKSCTSKDEDYPIIYRVLTISGG